MSVAVQPTPASDKPFVRIAEAADLLGISRDTLMRNIRDGLRTGEIVSYRFGRALTISWQSLLDYLDTHFPGAFQPRKRGKK